MPYVPPSPADLKEAFPKFAAVPDVTVSRAIDLGMRSVDTTWTVGDYARGIMLAAAHEMTLDGLGDGTEAQLLGEGVNDFQRIQLGPLNLQRFDRAMGDDGSNVWKSTSYGKRFLDLAARNAGGPLVGDSAAGAVGACTYGGLYPERGW